MQKSDEKNRTHHFICEFDPMILHLPLPQELVITILNEWCYRPSLFYHPVLSNHPWISIRPLNPFRLHHMEQLFRQSRQHCQTSIHVGIRFVQFSVQLPNPNRSHIGWQYNKLTWLWRWGMELDLFQWSKTRISTTPLGLFKQKLSNECFSIHRRTGQYHPYVNYEQ